jgi:tRNA(His) 5'-end guanylyltransferase
MLLIIFYNVITKSFMDKINIYKKSKINIDLGDRMKIYELENESLIHQDEAFIIRLDGRCFSNFTKGCHKPYDLNFIKAMCLTMKDCINKFHAHTGTTHSDEITLIFNKWEGDPKNPNLMFNGRIQKILTLISSYCSVRFNYHFNQIIDKYEKDYDINFIKKIKNYDQTFDARILKFTGKKNYEILNHQIWRSIYDCYRNSILKYAYYYIGHKKIIGKNSVEMIEMLKEKNIDWNSIPLYIKYGLYCKRILIEKEIDKKSKDFLLPEKVMKSEYIFKQFKINFSEQNLKMLLNKYWEDMNDSITLDEL